jgi:16S rRNA (cytidine1402-2'-O)-methyltransferase
VAENPLWTQKLLQRYEIKTPIKRYHQHSSWLEEKKIISLLKEGKKIALVSDAGTPGVSDPGNKLVAQTRVALGDKSIVPIPGPSALTTAISVCGFPMDRFCFLGFLPKKKKRNKFLREIIEAKYPIIFYESCYRIIKTLKQLAEIDQTIEIFVGRELTKKFETLHQGEILSVIKEIETGKVKGEFVVIVKHE